MDKIIDEYIVHYNELLNIIETLTFDVSEYKEEKNNIKFKRGLNFYKLIDKSMFDLFCLRKLKVFSHKEEKTLQLSESMFGEKLPLKNIINNQSEKNKNKVWSLLQNIYINMELLQKQPDEKKIKKINDQKSSMRQYLNNIVEDIELNEQTYEMLLDIVRAFDKVMKNNIKNPMEHIMAITKKLSLKYKEKIENKEIDVKQLINGIKKKIPGLEEVDFSSFAELFSPSKPKEKIIIDDNFSTSMVEQGVIKENNINISKYLILFDKFGPDFKFGDLLPNIPDEIKNNLSDMFSKLQNSGDLNNEINKINSFIHEQFNNKNLDTLIEEVYND